MNSFDIGVFGEDAAEEYLRKQKYRLVARNFKTTFGEIDIIARSGDEIVFVEVKTRSRKDFGRAAEYVDSEKIRRITATGRFFISYYNCNLKPRIDVIEVYIRPDQGKYVVDEINHLKNVSMG